MRKILTASWFAKLPADAAAVGISRGVPRGRSGYYRLRALEPGPWFRSVPPDEYLKRYHDILDKHDPSEIRDRLLAFGGTPVMLCYESAADCDTGHKWCHRHLAAQWLEDRLGITVEEVGHPKLDRFAHLRALGIAVPAFKTPSRPKKTSSDNDFFRK
jgi:hypothetical protein